MFVGENWRYGIWARKRTGPGIQTEEFTLDRNTGHLGLRLCLCLRLSISVLLYLSTCDHLSHTHIISNGTGWFRLLAE